MAGLGDVVDGWIWGNVAGVAVRAGREPVEVISVALQTGIKVRPVVCSLRPSKMALIIHCDGASCRG